jgi:hypothetical protein
VHHYQRWRSVIGRARTRQEVDQVVREYVACLLPSELLKLPESSQAAVTEATIDLAGAALALRRDELGFKGDDETAALMHEMTQTFSAASARIAHLEQKEPH